jgi:predicted membrane-bound spermidine synthase
MRTLDAAGLVVSPYEGELPALGLWGFLLAARLDGPHVARSGDERRVRWPALDERLALRPLSRDGAPRPDADDAPTRLDDLRVVRLLAETRAAEHR